MLVGAVIAYILGVLFAGINLNDIYFVIVIFIFYVLTLYKYKILKDIKTALSFIILIPAFFILGIMHFNYAYKPVSYLAYTKTELEFSGTIIDSEKMIDKNLVTARVSEFKNLKRKEAESYIKIPVSMFQNYHIGEIINFKGETRGVLNYEIQNTYKLFFSYETEKFLQGRVINVSPYSHNIEVVGRNSSLYITFLKNLNNLKMSFIKVLQKYLNEPYASLASGITFGETGYLSREVHDNFKASGLIHLMVLSGSNISFVIAIIWMSVRRLRPRKKVILSFSIAWIFIFLTGLTAPAVRAGIMASFAILSEASGRSHTMLRGLVLALGLQTLLDPMSLIYSPSLHLSFLACFGLFIVSPILENKFFKVKNFFTNLTSLIIGMFISTSIYILSMAGSVSIVGGLLTLLSEPFIFISTILSFLTIITNLISTHVSMFVSLINTFCLSIFLYLAETGAKYFPQLQIAVNREFVFFYYFIFINLFIFLYYKNSNFENTRKFEMITLQK